MARDLKTGWKRIGRSGPATDGRVIKPEMIDQAAANYNKDMFTALIWPEHFRYINLGTVEELRAADNEEGGRDLFAVISPNQFYLQANNAGQKLFTSMELTPDFRKTGQWYLTGLGATDDPASAATTEMRLSASAKPGVFLSRTVEHEEIDFNDPEKPGFMQRLATALFTKPAFEEEDMATPTEIEKLQAKIKELEDKFAALNPGAGTQPPAEGANSNATDDDKFATLFNKLSDTMMAKIDAKFAALNPPPAESDADKLKALQDDLKAISEKLSAAMQEQPGTSAGEHFGSGEKADDYI